ncbi:MAG: SPOR domain-containing protein [Armatimonadetes bacterium]|nr:SPOR domain-containing protein [Armatimonadota bacterium]MDW8028302.1 SPOR domain-containing protein [Armatimonadota bacterium]
MTRNEWKLVLAFIVGAVLSFLVGMYVLGPLFVAHRSNETKGDGKGTLETGSLSTLADSTPNGVYRRDVDSVPDATAVIVEPIPRPSESETRIEQYSEPIPEPSTITPRQPSYQPRQNFSPESPEPVPVEPTPPPTIVQPPQPPEHLLPPPPASETKRNYRVRLGIFSREENVKRMMEALSNQGYQPYTEEEFVGGQKRYRIYVGAFDNRESAEKLKQELAEKGFPGIVEEKQE